MRSTTRLQDIVIRYERLRGKDALWVVGTDHAGIATQMVVERQMNARQATSAPITRASLHRQGVGVEGRERRHDHRPAPPPGLLDGLGREQFTMDPHFTRAVVKVFVDLYNRRPDLPRQAAGELGSQA
jgi:valyl-tRNA synthetase